MIELVTNWGVGFAIIMGLVLLAVMFYTVVALRKQVSNKKKPRKKPASELLNEKYARGEIDRKEYESRKNKLK